jgi:hypothetical protein
VSEVPTDLIVAKNFSKFSIIPIYLLHVSPRSFHELSRTQGAVTLDTGVDSQVSRGAPAQLSWAKEREIPWM